MLGDDVSEIAPVPVNAAPSNWYDGKFPTGRGAFNRVPDPPHRGGRPGILLLLAVGRVDRDHAVIYCRVGVGVIRLGPAVFAADCWGVRVNALMREPGALNA